MDDRFVTRFVLVSGILAGAAYLTLHATTNPGVIWIGMAAVVGAIGVVGFISLARIVVAAERRERQL